MIEVWVILYWCKLQKQRGREGVCEEHKRTQQTENRRGVTYRLMVEWKTDEEKKRGQKKEKVKPQRKRWKARRVGGRSPESQVRKKDGRWGKHEMSSQAPSAFHRDALEQLKGEFLHQRLASFSTTRNPAAVLPGNYIWGNTGKTNHQHLPTHVSKLKSSTSAE